MTLGSGDQIDIRALALNTTSKNINNRVFLKKLAAAYNVTPEQLGEAITYFQERFSLQKNNSYPYPNMRMSPSFSSNKLPAPTPPLFVNTVWNPSRRFDRRRSHSPNRHSPPSVPEIDFNSSYPNLNEPAGKNSFNSEMPRLSKNWENVQSYLTGGMQSVPRLSVSRNNMYNDGRSTRSPSLSLSVQQVQALPVGYEHIEQISPLSSPRLSLMSSGFVDPSAALPLSTSNYRYPTAEILTKATGSPLSEVTGISSGFSNPEGNEQKCLTVSQTPKTELPTIPEAQQRGRPSLRKSPTTKEEALDLQKKVEQLQVTSPLTKKNLALYNEQVPPLKKNSRKVVRSWFRKYFSPNADSKGLISGYYSYNDGNVHQC